MDDCPRKFELYGLAGDPWRTADRVAAATGWPAERLDGPIYGEHVALRPPAGGAVRVCPNDAGGNDCWAGPAGRPELAGRPVLVFANLGDDDSERLREALLDCQGGAEFLLGDPSRDRRFRSARTGSG